MSSIKLPLKHLDFTIFWLASIFFDELTKDLNPQDFATGRSMLSR